MEITEDKVRDVTAEALRVLGPDVRPEVLKRVIREVIRRLAEESQTGSCQQRKA